MKDEALLICIIFGFAGSIAFNAPATSLLWPNQTENRECFKEEIIYFESGSITVSGEATNKVLKVANCLKVNPSDVVIIEGHSDHRGPVWRNRALGQWRALALRNDLIRLGVDPSRVYTTSYGEDRHAGPGHDRFARKRNRRAEFVLLAPPSELGEADSTRLSARENSDSIPRAPMNRGRLSIP
jgi:outer membrane protein OmpA-like peptidoglycan-associated protein